MTDVAAAQPSAPRLTAPQLSAAQRLRPREMHEEAQMLEAEFRFDDLIDIVNPLQHLPVISTLYREITGDQISGPARIMGGTLFGGIGGGLSAILNAVFEEATDRDLGATALAIVQGEPLGSPDAQVASAAPGPTEDPASIGRAPAIVGGAEVGEVQLAALPDAPPETATATLQAAPGPVPIVAVERTALAEPPVAQEPEMPPGISGAADHPRNQIPREVLEALYQMHRDRLNEAALDHEA